MTERWQNLAPTFPPAKREEAERGGLLGTILAGPRGERKRSCLKWRRKAKEWEPMISCDLDLSRAPGSQPPVHGGDTLSQQEGRDAERTLSWAQAMERRTKASLLTLNGRRRVAGSAWRTQTMRQSENSRGHELIASSPGPGSSSDPQSRLLKGTVRQATCRCGRTPRKALVVGIPEWPRRFPIPFLNVYIGSHVFLARISFTQNSNGLLCYRCTLEFGKTWPNIKECLSSSLSSRKSDHPTGDFR